MDNEESLSHQLAIKLLIEELEVDDALKEKRRQRASAEVLADRAAPEESTALPSGTSNHTDRLRDLYQDTLGPSVVDKPSQEIAGEKGLVVDAAGNAPKPSPAPVTEDDDHKEDDDDLYRDDGVTINRRPEASPARTVAPVPAPVTEGTGDLYRDDGKTLDRKPEPSIARLADISHNLSRDDKFSSPPESPCTETSVRSSGTVLRPETSPSRLFRPQPSSSRFAPFANPRPEDNVRPRGANAETDPDKENVYCHSCGNDCEESVVLCPCGHYYCPQCLGRIVESSVGGDSSPFPPLCCGKPVPVDVNSTIFDKDVLKAFMKKKLGLPLSARATRAAQTLPPAAKVGP
ncbi:hypothetical protein NW754_007984 [Fusarium falciforme]|nr:hypothetical protein NW754_007984 [Fusarium falciforme]